MGKNQEIEAKFYIRGLEQVEGRLKTLPAKRIQPRTYEYNLRFDTPARELTHSVQVLRLRQDTANHMTYKGPGIMIDGVRLRKEIEFEVSDFENAQAFLEALGFQVSMIYEKYRAVYQIEDALVALDEMPYGNFVEIEGQSSASIRAICQKLNLNWEARINDSYAVLFQVVCKNLGVQIANLTFEDFSGVKVTDIHLETKYAE